MDKVNALPAAKRTFALPSSVPVSLGFSALFAGQKNIGNLPYLKSQIDHNDIDISVESDGQTWKIKHENPKTGQTATLEIDLQTGNNKGVMKMFIFALKKINEPNIIYDGVLQQDFVSFPLQELVDSGAYGNKDSARRAFYESSRTLLSMKMMGSVQFSKKKRSAIDSLSVIFTDFVLDNGQGQCYIYLNKRIDWNFFATGYALYPYFIFLLSQKAVMFTHELSTTTRQRSREIKKYGYYRLKLSTIQRWLQLPELYDPKTHKIIERAAQFIRYPIENTIEEVEVLQNEIDAGNPLYQFEYDVNPKATTEEWLVNGYLKVFPRGELKQQTLNYRNHLVKKFSASKKKN